MKGVKKGTSLYDGRFSKDQLIGSWVVLDATIYRGRKGYATLHCRCKCGVEKYVDVHSLLVNKSKTCYNCSIGDKIGNKNTSWKGVGEIPGRYFKQRTLKDYPKEFKIYLWELFLKQERKCALTGLTISFADNTASLDRINSDIGYEKENVQWVHKDINIMKNKYPEEYFIEMCKKVVEHKGSM